MQGRSIRTPKKRRAFLVALAETGNVTIACKRAKVSKEPVYTWRHDDVAFRADWDAALDTAADLLEEEARRRAAIGVDEPVYQGGHLVGMVRKYSDTLLIFLLKGIRPTKYRERVQVDISVLDREIERAREMFGLSDEEAEQLKALAVADAEAIVKGGRRA